MADKRKGKIKNKLKKRLEGKIDHKIAERKVVLDQLALLDAELDGIDEVIIKIDKKIPPLVEEINDAIDDVKAAYDARIAGGCRSNLRWELGEKTYERASFGFTQTAVVKNTAPSELNKVGVKYFKKEQDRDYGTNIIQNFVGVITAGHNVMAVVNPEPQIDRIKVKDFITDSFRAPEVFAVGHIPEIVSIGTTTVVREVGVVNGSIELGSIHFANTGIGSTTSAPVDYHFIDETHFSEDTRVVGFGTTTVSRFIVDPVAGVSTAFEETVPTFVLSKPALVGITTDIAQDVTIGVTSSFPSFVLSGLATVTTSDRSFVAYRVDRDADNEYTQNSVDAEFNYLKSPVDPIEIGLINSQSFGFGYRIQRVQNGHPDPGPGNFETWESQKSTSGLEFDSPEPVEDEHPEPRVGAGIVTYFVGVAASFPTIVQNGDRTGGLGAQTQYAVLNQPSTTGVGEASGFSDGTHSYTPTPNPATYVGVSACNDLDDAITAAENALTNIRNENEPKIDKFIDKSKTLRKLRDELQLEAWGLLQAAAYNREQIAEMAADAGLLDSEEFEEFDT